MTTYGYIRVSTLEQAADDRTSLETQSRIIRGKAMGRGLPDPVIFTDIGVSGADRVESRPKGAVMLKALRAGDTLIVSKMDRLFRSLADASATADDFVKRKIDLIIADLGDDPVTQNGVSKMFFGMMACVAEFERWRIAERMADGKRGKAARGGHVGGMAPYGFQKIGDGREARLVEDPREKIIVDRIKMLRLRKLSVRKISADLTENGIFNRAGEAFDPRQILRIAGRA